MKNEMKYKIHVEPAIRTIINKVAQDCEAFGIEPDDFMRAVWSWADDKLNEYMNEHDGGSPQWLWLELDKKQQLASALNTVDGEVTG